MTVGFLAGPGTPRVAYAIGRRVGPAVTRNRIKRRLRAIVAERDRREPLPSGAYLISVGPAAATSSFAELTEHLEAGFDHLASEPS